MKAGACHILVKTEKLANDLKKQLSQGANFQQLAKKYSICPSAKRGGDLGEIRPGQMIKPFENVVFKKPLLTIHGPLKTRFGYHLIKILYRG